MSILTMTRILILGFLAAIKVAIAQSPSPAQRAPEQYTGTFAATPVELPGVSLTIVLTPAKPTQLSRLPVLPQKGALVFFGSKDFYDQENGKVMIKKSIPVALTVSKDSVVLYANINGDTIFTLQGRHVLKDMSVGGPVKVYPGDKDVWLQIPLPIGGMIASYPIHLIWSPQRLAETVRDGLSVRGIGTLTMNSGLLWETQQMLQGEVDINGTKVLLQYDIDPITGNIRDDGMYGVDANGDGEIDKQSPAEWVYRGGDSLILRVGENIYFSPLSHDNSKRQFVLIERTAADYKVVVLVPGNIIPDFNFIDLKGTNRKLSDFRGKYVLLDFWAVGCTPCVMEFPHLRAAYEKYNGRGFEILGINYFDTDLKMLKAFLAKKNATWLQASTTVPGMGVQFHDFITKTLRVSALPTTVLVDPTGRIISTNNRGELPLRGQELMQTLDKLLPASSQH